MHEVATPIASQAGRMRPSIVASPCLSENVMLRPGIEPTSLIHGGMPAVPSYFGDHDSKPSQDDLGNSERRHVGGYSMASV
jgi:hypothetical protein